ncbi:MAG: ATP-binding cassette domain-containing protein [Oscillospiraceae bacterium]
MLELRGIQKDYPAGSGVVHALKGIDLQFRQSEFVAILGPSGCGKTTMLNIIGGLDGYTDGDLIINGVSTKRFKDRDWDTYRNHSVGFVFQSYNLIPHQTVLQNVELALTLSGVSKAERRERAKKALEQVGLGDQLSKKPNEMSGGQMQRVAIARALVNNPDIILADEPTGALDTETSVQVMDILKEVSKDRLVVMVTHNPDLAEQYASRIIRVLDGRLLDDSNPLTGGELAAAHAEFERLKKEGRKEPRKPSMSFGTSFMLSLKNLFTKKGRTILTAFAGSIGIFGIALILSLSTGINNYIDQVQQDTLASYPITIESESVDMSSMITSFMGEASASSGEEHEEGRVYTAHIMYDMLDAMLNMETTSNNLEAFKEYLDNGGGGISDLATIQYSYDLDFDVYTKDEEGTIVKSDLMALIEDAFATLYGGSLSATSSMMSMYNSMDVWEELLAGEDGQLVADQLKDQYDLVYGRWPEAYDEVVLFVNEHNEISDLMLISLGLVPSSAMDNTLTAIKNGESVEAVGDSWTYEELCGLEYKLILPAETYQYDEGTGTYVDMSATAAGMELLYNSADVGTPLKVVGIVRPDEEATSTMVTGAIGYTTALTRYAIETIGGSDAVIDQLADPTVDVLTGLPFATGEETEPTAEEKAAAVTGHLTGLPAAEKAAAYMDVMSQPAEDYVAAVVEQQMGQMTRETIEAMIVEQYAAEMGVDASTIMGYISQMSDEELFAQVESAIDTQVREQYAAAAEQQLAAVPQQQLATMMDTVLTADETTLAYAGMTALTAAQIDYLYDNYMPATVSDSTYEDNLDLLGYVDLAKPSTISLYATTFSDKDAIADLIREYNDGAAEEDRIEYTDYVALLMSSITSIISGITYVLIAFVAISLVVSSIMIGVITLISVQERTKEIGILRAIGASKKDVSGMFNAETLIIGLCSGLVGIAAALLLTIPINAILLHFTGIAGLKATMPWQGALILIAISALLTLIAGLIPSRSAAKKDPVVALRTE